MTGKHRRRARWRAVALIAGAGVIGGVAAFAFVASRPPIAIPDDPCVEPPPLRTVDGVTLQPAAMEAFRDAQRQAGVDIPVVWSYRSCRQQRIACRTICGDPGGCPELCAPPGRSWHQLGAAIDTTEQALADPRVVRALLDNGWCQPLSGSDPGHFSFGGCR